MSGSSKPDPAPPAAGGDPSMEDILASIRRILSEDEAAPVAAPPLPAAAPAPPQAEEDVLVLDSSMLRGEPAVPEPPPQTEVEPPPMEPPPPVPALAAAPAPEPPDPAPTEGLVAPEAAAAAAASVAGLLRAIASDRALQVRSGGPTLEDLARQALRPLLKEWLDAHLPDLVERLVRTEIERVVSRALH